MKRLLIAAGLIVAIWLGYGWWNSDSRQIGKALDRFEHACDKDGPDSPLSIIGRTETILAAFAPGFVATANPWEGTFTDPVAVAGAIQRYRALANRVRVSDTERSLEVKENGTAEMTATFRVQGDAGLRGGEAFRARIFWVKDQGDWKIREFRIVERLETGGILP
jgi:hypothetical protein